MGTVTVQYSGRAVRGRSHPWRGAAAARESPRSGPPNGPHGDALEAGDFAKNPVRRQGSRAGVFLVPLLRHSGTATLDGQHGSPESKRAGCPWRHGFRRVPIAPPEHGPRQARSVEALAETGWRFAPVARVEGAGGITEMTAGSLLALRTRRASGRPPRRAVRDTRRQPRVGTPSPYRRKRPDLRTSARRTVLDGRSVACPHLQVVASETSGRAVVTRFPARGKRRRVGQAVRPGGGAPSEPERLRRTSGGAFARALSDPPNRPARQRFGDRRSRGVVALVRPSRISLRGGGFGLVCRRERRARTVSSGLLQAGGRGWD